MNDASTAAVPGSLPVSNSQCTLNSAQATGQSGTLTLQISLSFLPAFVGPLTVWEEAIDNASPNQTSSWTNLGTWTAYAASTTAPVVSVVTNPNGGTTGTFTFHVNDVNGYKYVNRYLMTIGAHDSANSCEFLYYTSLNGIQILSDDGTTWQLWSPLGTGGSAVGNSQCTVDALHASVTTQGTNDEYITLPVTFTSAYLAGGTEPIFGTVIDRAQGWPWTQVGTWTGSGSAPPVITSASPLPTGTINRAYSTGLTAAGGAPPYIWGLTSNPAPGLTLSSTGVFSGTPSATGSFSMSVWARDSSGIYAYATLTLPVVSGGGGNPPVITTASPLPMGSTQASYAQNFGAAGGSSPYAWSVVGGSIPPGLSFSSAGALSGTPQTQGTYNFTVQVMGSDGRSSPGYFSLGVSLPPPVIRTLTDLQSCLNGGSALCELVPGTYVVDSTANGGTGTIVIPRYGVTLAGRNTGSDHTQTRLVRAQHFMDPLVSVAVAGILYSPPNATQAYAQAHPLQGVTIQNITVCGGSTLTASISGGSPCGDQHSIVNDCQAAVTAVPPTSGGCVDLAVDSVDSGLYPSDANPPNPFSFFGPYALDINNVDFEDAAGNAVTLYAAATPNQYNAPATRINDVYIHNSVISYSEVTGILYGTNFVDYQDKFCDGYIANAGTGYAFADDPVLFAPRNIRIDGNTFVGNNTGALGGGAMRRIGLRNNTFTNNYINPQVGNVTGGTVELTGCTDQAQITGNTFTGPASYPFTDALEIYGRNMSIAQNNISGYGQEGIGAHSLYNTTIQNNNLQNNDYTTYATQGPFNTGGVKLVTSFGGGCAGVPRDTQTVTISGNTSAGQAYGIHFNDQGTPSRNTLNNVTIDGTNNLSANRFATVARDVPQLVLNGFAYPGTLTSLPPVDYGPRALGVDPVSPVISPCSTQGSEREIFTFPASDNGGPGNIAWIQGAFTLRGDDTTGAPGPVIDAGAGDQGCHFIYFPPMGLTTGVIYLDSQNGGSNWVGSSVVGSGGSDLSNPLTPGAAPFCIIHAGSSSSYWHTEPYIGNLTLDIEFPSLSAKKHTFSITSDGQQQSSGGGWNYWGWLTTP